jgi:hypothetical protein
MRASAVRESDPPCYNRLMTSQLAILGAAVIVGASIIGARVIAPCEISATTGSQNPMAWHVNTITGEVDACGFVRKDGPRPVVECRHSL